MTPQPGQHVKCILRNGAMAEGIVEEWFGNVVQLKSLDGESVLIITHPAEDIMLIKIILDKKPEEEQNLPTEEGADEFVKQFAEADASHDPTNPDDRKSLAELRIELIKQERKIIAEKLKNHRPSSGPGKVQYGYPGLNKKPSPQQHPTPQTSSSLGCRKQRPLDE